MTQLNMNEPVRFLSGMGRNFHGGEVEAMVGDQRVTLTLTPSDVHDPSELPEYLFGYKPFKYRGTEMCPVVPVDKDTDKFRVFSSDNAFEHVEVKASIQSAPPEIDATSSLDDYTVVDRFIGGFIPTVTEEQATYGVRTRTAARCADAIYLDMEIDITTLLGTNTNWNAAVRTAAGNVWTDETLGTPVTDVMTAIEKSYQEVTGLWLNEKAAHIFLRHPQTKDHMRQFYGDNPPPIGQGGVITDFQIPGLPPFHVIKSRYLSSGTMTYCLGAVVVLISGPPTPPTDGMEIMSAATFRRKGANGTGWETREWFVNGRGPRGGNMVVVSEASNHKFVSTYAGGIITGIYT